MSSFSADGPELYMIDPSGVSWGYHGCSIGKAKQAAKTEIEKLKMKDMTCEELVKEVAKIIYVVHDEVKDKNFELELSWIGDVTNDKHAGALKFVDGKLMVCLGDRWAEVNPKVDDDAYAYGTEFNPGESCKDLKNKLGGSPSDGVYWIKLPSAEKGFPVYCDMKGGGWTLVFKLISGIPEVHLRHSYNGAVPSAEFVEEALSLTNDFKGHYKNRLGIPRYWHDFSMEKLKIGLYSSSGESLLKDPLIFKVNKETPVENFFVKENVEKSPWTDLKTTERPAAFHTFGPLCQWGDEHCRSFEAMKTYGDDRSAKAEKRCEDAVGEADVMGIFVK
ncbi:PREDICTED: uncharacterized protein LOC107327342 isoform X2 [Acropora digitifera]|uniref:uncharacterized protein LOC107327342 isoform X2 n=1 Tax=Acropora digitifera TaxID=70779 RepID=UPI00077B07CC|nr:PREDICTED: uncharacterized protein LOC107327342 isoform X2 [Acropora digitifera]